MSAAARELVALLCGQRLEALLAAARRRVEERDGMSGTVAIALDPEQVTALAGLVGWKPVLAPHQGALRIDVRELDAKLRASRFAVGLWDVLIAHGGPVVTRGDQAAAAATAGWAQLARLAAAAPAAPWVQGWLQGLAGDGPSARWYRRAYRDSPAAAEGAALAAARALAALPPPPGELLAVFAARITGDPHAFDGKQPAGALLLTALSERFGAVPEGLRESEARALLLALGNLDVDGVSSTALAAHLHTARHPVVAAMAREGGAWPLPLRELRRTEFAPGRGRPVYVAENPQVFEHLVRGLSGRVAAARPALVCTGGFLSAAAVHLLDGLHGSGHQLWYGGDFDRNGLAIAGWLAARYPGLVLWRMGPVDYRAALGDEPARTLSDADRAWLRQQEGPIRPTALLMVDRGAAAYQERLADRLLDDLAGAGG